MEDKIQKMTVMQKSTTSQPTNKPQSPLPHQSSETQSDLNNKATSSDIQFEPNKTIASTVVSSGTSQAAQKDPERKSKPNERLRPNKRKTCTNKESPSKRQSASKPTEAPLGKALTENASTGKERPCKRKRGASKHTEMPKLDAPMRNTSSERERPRKRKRGASKSTEMPLLEALMRNTSSERERPSKKQRGNDSFLSKCGSDFSTPKQEERSSTVLLGKTRTADFNTKYKQLGKIGGGGFGLVYAGTRISDQLPVAIKHIHKADVKRRSMVINGRKCQIPLEVVLMHKAAGEPESVGKSTAVSLLDWYDLGDKVLLVMERPVMSMDLSRYLDISGPLQEALAKVIMKQVVDAAIQMDSEKIFHRDIKSENILLQATSNVPRVRVIDFGCGCILSKRRYRYRTFFGTLIYVPPEFETHGVYEAGPTTVCLPHLGFLEYADDDWFPPELVERELIGSCSLRQALNLLELII
uniref:serine/threonine-protein kinase PAK 3-like n=1 Tax=Solea senegalensis TaxID=28829 RepID=UPI001CD83919|nr:serine/threonine-protein kinase PAK 3-like [Solea senegalensis]